MDFAITEQVREDIERVVNRLDELLIDFFEKTANIVKEIARIMWEVCEKIERTVDEIMIERERRRKTRRYMALKVLSVYTGIEMLDIRKMLRRVYRARSCC